MKKFCFKILPGVLLVLLLAMWGCSSKSEPVTPGGSGEFTVYLLDKPSGDWGLWYWLNDSTGETKDQAISENVAAWPKGASSLTGQDEKGSFIRFDINNWSSFDRLGLLFVNRDNGDEKTSDTFVPKEVLQEYKTVYFVYSNPTVYYTDYESTQGLQSAEITSYDMMVISAVVRNVSKLDQTLLSVKDAGGEPLTVQNAVLTGTELTITLATDGTPPYQVTYNGKTVTAQPSVSVIDEKFYYDGDDLGLTFSGSQATFKAWIPVAEKVELLLFKEAGDFKTSDASYEMTRGDKGVWSYTLDDSAGYEYYQYKITRGGETVVVCDIWGKAASPDSVASQIVDISTDPSCAPEGWETGYTNPFGTNGTVEKKYSDAIIYEMHIRDWSRAYVADSTGKFIDLANSEGFVKHLTDLGITHVQLVPVFDYAQTNDDESYNWGYNPYHYNVPEGRYVENMKDGSDSVKQFRTFIKKLHDAGIAVNMDVVYNHTSGTGDWSLYDKTVPQYFYRMDSAGNYSNGSGCGNEVATNHKMVEKYVIDSLKHWMKDYHINGFRFDLMGLHETSFMKKVYEELSLIDKNVMVYGEPWTGGTAAVVNGVSKSTIDDCAGDDVENWVACFNDDFRNAIKGAEYGGFQQGHVQGKYNDKEIVKGLKGSLKEDEGFTNVLGRSLNYVECHDNYTLFDKLAISYLNKTSYDGDLFTAIDTGLEEVKKQDKLSAAFVFLAQGTPFINGGQEFLRTKKGDENSYESPDTINQINIGFKETYSDVYNTYKGLIALRKANSAAFGENDAAEASTPRSGITKYTTGNFLVFFNATASDYPIPDGDKTVYKKAVDVSSGAVKDGTIPSSVPAKGFVILKK